jgi:hypothetical protein
MNLVKSEVKWNFFDKSWADTEQYEDAILEAYFMEVEYRNVVTFDHIRENAWIEEEVKLPIVSYLCFDDVSHYREMDVDESQQFIDIYEDCYSEIENDIITMIDTKRLFLHLFEDKYLNIPCVQVW